jgi:hypothetical protein
MKTKLHHNGTVSYYSMHKRAWIMGASYMPASEIATYPEPFRTKLIKHLAPRLIHARARTQYQQHPNP